MLCPAGTRRRRHELNQRVVDDVIAIRNKRKPLSEALQAFFNKYPHEATWEQLAAFDPDLAAQVAFYQRLYDSVG
jgi:acetyl-CoA carboxylase carboxyltransferase component